MAGTVELAFPSADNPTNPNSNAPFQCRDPTICTPDPVCLVGLASCGAVRALAPVRTVWKEDRAGD